MRQLTGLSTRQVTWATTLGHLWRMTTTRSGVSQRDVFPCYLRAKEYQRARSISRPRAQSTTTMDLLHDRINTWIETVSNELGQSSKIAPTLSWSRRHRHHGAKGLEKGWVDLPSPPPSLKRPGMVNSPARSPKRQRTKEDDHTDTERTPRPSNSRSITGPDKPDLPPSECSSVASGKSSPSRQADQLRRKAKGVEIRTMDIEDGDMPQTLQDFIPGIQMIASGLHIVPDDLRVNRRPQCSLENPLITPSPRSQDSKRLVMLSQIFCPTSIAPLPRKTLPGRRRQTRLSSRTLFGSRTKPRLA